MKRLFFLLCLIPTLANAAVYLDGSTTGCVNGSSTYSPATRSCGGGSDTVYLDLAAFGSGIAAGQTNYMRAGSYFRDNAAGALYIPSGKAGTSGSYTIIKAYGGEERQVNIGTATRGATYNSNPADATGAGSWNYYPNVAVSVEADYVELNGVKTYGEVSTNGANYIRIVNNDLGGGGPATSGQGAVVKLENLAAAYVFNNLIHNSTLAVDSSNNGPGIIIYNAYATITQNTFYDNYSADIYAKDSGAPANGQTTEISYNFFKPSTIRAGGNAGVTGHNQDVQLAQFLVHHNVFLGKLSGYAVATTPPTSKFYSNTLVNCATDIDNSSSAGTRAVESSNNLMFHATSQYFTQLYSTTYSDFFTASNFNIYYTTGSKWAKSAPGATTWETTLAGWQTRTGLDADSLNVSPSFANATGTAAVDFKRSAYAENFAGSSYGSHAGAYLTGTEVVGFTETAPLTPTHRSLIGRLSGRIR